MNTLDLVLLAILSISLVWGAVRGLLWQLASLAVIILGFILGTTHCTTVGGALAIYLNVENVNLMNMMAFALIFMLVAVGCYLTAHLLKKFLSAVKLESTDHLLGGMLGVLKGFILSWALLLLAVNLPGSELNQQAKDSALAPHIVGTMRLMGRMLPEQLHMNMINFLCEHDAEACTETQVAGEEESPP